jgi:hypothetical protein
MKQNQNPKSNVQNPRNETNSGQKMPANTTTTRPGQNPKR